MSLKVEEISIDSEALNTGLNTDFKSTCKEGEVKLSYNYIAEPNNGRIQLELELAINGKSILNDFGISKDIELPYQYPRPFELYNENLNVISIPHNQGIIVLNLNDRSKQLIKYKSSEYEYSYFYDHDLVLVESKFLTISSLINTDEKHIDLNEMGRVFINGTTVTSDEVHILVRNADINDVELIKFNRHNLGLLSKLQLSKTIKDDQFDSALSKTKVSKLAAIPDFKYPSIISSWRGIQNIEHNSFIGRVEKWDNPIKKKDTYERKEYYGFVKITID